MELIGDEANAALERTRDGVPWSPRARRLLQLLVAYGVPLLDDRDGEDTGHLVDVDAHAERIEALADILAWRPETAADRDLVADLRSLLRRRRHGEWVYTDDAQHDEQQGGT